MIQFGPKTGLAPAPQCRAFASHAGERGSIPGRDRPRTAPLSSARHQVRVSRVLGHDHYKRMTRS